MGLLDKITESIGDTKGVDISIITKWIEELGGVSGILEKFKLGGTVNLIQSWIGDGDNLPISSDQIKEVFGDDSLKQLGEKIGKSGDEASSIISDFLPKIIDMLTPDGLLGSGNSEGLLAKGASLLKKFFG